MGYIYIIRNSVNGKCYIGKTERLNPYQRWKEHLRAVSKKTEQHRSLYRAMNKYGSENFSFSILEKTENTAEREQFYIAKYQTYHYGYNQTLGGDGKCYLELNEPNVCAFYKNHTLAETAQHFSCDPDSISKVLSKNKIKKRKPVEVSKQRLSKKVAQKDLLTGEVLKIFPSTKEAEMFMTGNPDNHGGTISRVCRGERKQAFGFCWQYIQAA